jgi:hypothetical protein
MLLKESEKGWDDEEEDVIRRNKLLDDLKETGGYWKLKQEALDCVLWRTRSGRSCRGVVRQST